MRWLLVTCALAGCAQTSTYTCETGVVCPSTLRCDEAHGGCVLPEQLTACTGQAPFTACSYAGVTDGRCFDGVCLSAGCGNGFVEPEEVCDDTNRVAGDGCGASCESDESCGNGKLDLEAGEECDDSGTLNHDGCSASCRPEVATFRRFQFALTGPISGHALAYDAARGRVVMFGGTDDGSFQRDETWEWNGRSWRELTPRAGNPTTRVGHALAYDTDHRRLLMFGGTAGIATNDLWSWNGGAWQQLQPVGARPPSRSRHGLAYDPARHVLVLHGGIRDDGTSLADTWEWNGTSWLEVTPASGPPARDAHALVYDPRRGRTVMFGGQRDGALLADTWDWDGTSWTDVTPASGSPPARALHAMAYDAARGGIVLFGGRVSGSLVADTWQWSGSAWQQLTVSSTPSPRAAHALAYDASRARLVLVGGYDASNTRFGDVWEWDGLTWQQMTPATDVPSARSNYAFAYDALRGRVVLFGGRESAANAPADTWEFDATGWRKLAPPGAVPAARRIVASTYDLARGRVVMFGGFSSTLAADTWEWDGTKWLDVTPASGSPPGRYGAAIGYDHVRQRTVLFAGTDGPTSFLGDTWEWDGISWQPRPSSPAPNARWITSGTYDSQRSRFVIFGGGDAGRAYDDIWSWDGQSWMNVTPTSGVPSPRGGAALVYDASARLVLMFGGHASENFGDLWTWNGATWEEQSTGLDAPSPRDTQLAYSTLLGGSVLFGGILASPETLFDDTWLLRFDGPGDHETCLYGIDADGDSFIGCDDADCWGYCTPTCPPGTICDSASPRCGDGTCNTSLETCRLCPQDCGVCPAQCGDYVCAQDESAATCPGDCAASE